MENKQAWGIHEANMQSYRSIMLSSQSLLLAVGAILIEKTSLVLVPIAAIAIFQLWYIWFRVIYSRMKIVDYYKFEMYKTKKYDVNQYVCDRNIRSKLNNKYSVKGTFRPTRIKLDIILPITINLVWIIIIFYNIL